MVGITILSIENLIRCSYFVCLALLLSGICMHPNELFLCEVNEIMMLFSVCVYSTSFSEEFNITPTI